MTPEPMQDQRVFDLLSGVSRTFALSIVVLRGTLASDVATAYLLCRLLDTVEDDANLPATERRHVLSGLADGIGNPAQEAEALELLAGLEGRITATPVELELLAEAPALFARIKRMDAQRGQVLRRWAEEMARGMAEFVSDTPGASIHTLQDLARYCHYVAGTVGGMLTGLFALTGPGVTAQRQRRLETHMEAFGRGLQMVNIIKDCGKDWSMGRCFLPGELAGNEAGFRGAHPHLLGELVKQAEVDLDDAVRYIRNLPRRMWRARLFCVYPLVFARKTLRILAGNQARTGEQGPKISRKDVKRAMLFSAPAAFSNLWLRLVCRRQT
ncbi:MAG TPA: squalene/phytoene synthase family protein [Spirochaetota bacterium]|nr:squalene/phytoene synthase family protein [Spirochaetota bacterium]